MAVPRAVGKRGSKEGLLFRKKEAKNFCSAVAAFSREGRDSAHKSFLLLFCEKGGLPFPCRALSAR
jgi:hypothetical protein